MSRERGELCMSDLRKAQRTRKVRFIGQGICDMIRIEHLDIPELMPYRERSERRLFRWYEPQPGLFIAESVKVIARAAADGYRPESVLLEEKVAERLQEDGSLSSLMDISANGDAKKSPQGDAAFALQGADAALEFPGAETAPAFPGMDAAREDPSCGTDPLPRGGDTETMRRILSENEQVPVYTASYAVLSGIAGYHLTGGALAAMRRRSVPDLMDTLRGADHVAVLSHVTNPTNVGAIVRSAAAMGIDAVIFADGCADPLSRRAVRVSMGCIFQIPWTCAAETEGVIGALRGAGFTTAAMALGSDSVRIDDPVWRTGERVAAFFGNEGDGLREDVIRACDYSVRIPMRGGVDSLNVAAASAVAFWEMGRGKRDEDDRNCGDV